MTQGHKIEKHKKLEKELYNSLLHRKISYKEYQSELMKYPSLRGVGPNGYLRLIDFYELHKPDDKNKLERYFNAFENILECVLDIFNKRNFKLKNTLKKCLSDIFNESNLKLKNALLRAENLLEINDIGHALAKRIHLQRQEFIELMETIAQDSNDFYDSLRK